MYDVDWGVVMVMEVNMGVIKVIVNIEWGKMGWYEFYNYVIGICIEFGLIFKVVSMLVLLEDGFVNL